MQPPKDLHSSLERPEARGELVMPVFLQSLYRALAFWWQKNDKEVSCEKDPSEEESREGEWGKYILISAAG